MRPAASRPSQAGVPQAAAAAPADEGKLRDFGSSPVWSTTALAAGIRPFAGEREMWTSYSPEASRKRKLRATLATAWLLVRLPCLTCMEQAVHPSEAAGLLRWGLAAELCYTAHLHGRLGATAGVSKPPETGCPGWPGTTTKWALS